MMKKGVKLKILSLSLAAVLAVSGCIAAGAADVEEEPAQVGTAVETSFLGRTTIRSELTYIGQIQPQRTINVASMITAEVTAVHFNIGDSVEEGDILFTVDATDIQNNIRQINAAAQLANIGVESAQHQLEQAEIQQQMQDIQQEIALQQAATAAASAAQQLETANQQHRLFRDYNHDALRDIADERRELNREIRDLTRGHHRDEYIYNRNRPERFDPGLAREYEALRAMMRPLDAAAFEIERAQETLQNAQRLAEISQDMAEFSFESAEGVHDIYLQNNRDQVQIMAEFGLQTAQAQLASTQAQMSTARTNLNRATVTSPISGVVSGRTVEVGQMASPSFPPFTIVEIDTVVVQVSVSESLINRVYVGQEVDVVIQALDGETSLTGTVTIVSPIAAATSTFPIRVELDNADGRIRPGMFLQVTFVEAQRENTFVVPKNVVQTDEQGEFVFVVRDGYAVRTNVRTGMETGNEIEILSGISETDQIVTVGQEFLEDGELVNVVAIDGRRVSG